MVEYNGKKEASVPLMGQKQVRREKTEVYYKDEDKPEKKHKQPNDGGSVKMDKKPDAMRHDGKNVFGKEKKDKKCCPGQMYVPKKDHNESSFAGELKQKEMY